MENKSTNVAVDTIDPRNAPAGANGGVDHTLTPGENPLPDTDPNKTLEYNKIEKASPDQKMYAKNKADKVEDDEVSKEATDEEQDLDHGGEE